MTIPSEPCIFADTQKEKLNANITCMTISLDGLLDYNEEDKLEKTFEVSLFAEAFQEMLHRYYGAIILEAIKKYVEEKTKKRPRDEVGGTESETKRQKISETQVCKINNIYTLL